MKNSVKMGTLCFTVCLIVMILMSVSPCIVIGQTLNNPVIVNEGDPIFVKWDRPSETDINFYTLHLIPDESSENDITTILPHWAEGQSYKGQITVNLKSDIIYSLLLTATDFSGNESEPSEPIYFKINDTKPPGKIMGVEILIQ